MQSAALTDHTRRVTTIGKQKLKIGDWCLFQETNTPQFLIGRVKSLAKDWLDKKPTTVWDWGRVMLYSSGLLLVKEQVR